MTYIRLIMQVSHGLTYLAEEVAGLFLRQYPFRRLYLYVLIEADPTDKLLHQVYVFGGLEVLVELAHIGMIESLHAHDLPLHGLPLGRIVELILRVDLNGHLQLALLVLCQLHVRVGARPQVPHYDVVLQLA